MELDDIEKAIIRKNEKEKIEKEIKASHDRQSGVIKATEY